MRSIIILCLSSLSPISTFAHSAHASVISARTSVNLSIRFLMFNLGIIYNERRKSDSMEQRTGDGVKE